MSEQCLWMANVCTTGWIAHPKNITASVFPVFRIELLIFVFCVKNRLRCSYSHFPHCQYTLILVEVIAYDLKHLSNQKFGLKKVRSPLHRWLVYHTHHLFPSDAYIIISIDCIWCYTAIHYVQESIGIIISHWAWCGFPTWSFSCAWLALAGEFNDA